MKRNLLNIRVTEEEKRGLKTESSRRRKAAVFCFSVLLAIGVVFSGFAACGFGSPFVNTAYAASYDAEDVQVSQDGVTFTCDFLDDGTAVVTKIVADDGVTTVSVPSSLANNGKDYTVTGVKFPYGTKGSDVEQLILPDTLQTMSGYYFSKLKKVKELTIPGSVTNFSCTLQNSNCLEKLTFSEGVEELSANMMVANCGNLKEIVLPSTLKSISQPGAFSDASALEAINLPDGVEFGENVGSAFSDCSSLTSITLPASVTTIHSSMFKGCDSLTSITAKGNIESIGSSAFSGCKALTEVALQGKLTSVGDSAFQNCSSLENAPDLSAVTKLGSYAFYNCKSLSCSVDLSSLSEIPGYAFCYAPVTVEKFSDSLESIGKWALIWATIEDNLPVTLQSIGDYAFFLCDLPETFAIPDSVTSVGTGAFEETGGVKEITIGSGLTSISKDTFSESSVSKIVVNNSADNISGTDNLPSSGVEIVYLYESIDDSVGDTISEEAGAKTLQQVVNEAPDGVATTIAIKKHVKLGSTLNIPAGKNIIITCDDPHTILAKKNTAGSLVSVAEGATLELSGDVSLRGCYNAGAIIDCKGALVISGDATVHDGTVRSTNSGVVNLSGSEAVLTMNGGVIESCNIDEVYCGVVHAADGAKVLMQAGSIHGNRVAGVQGDGNYCSSAGVMLIGNASLEMTGGTIANNSGYQGSAVMVYGPDAGEGKRATFLMKGGSIEDNASNKLGNRTPSGAVHVEGNAEFVMTGGEISGNSASGGGKGGGVCVVDPGVQGSGSEMGTVFTMKAEDDANSRSASTGGTISGNTAYAGGGVYSYSNGVTLSAGVIEGNTAWSMGGGVYSEGNRDYYSTLHVQNASITQNSASKQGGGLWFCPTGDGKAYVQDGGLIAKNKADGVGDDVVFIGFKDDPYTLTLANRAPGGGKVLWYEDGGLFEPAGMFAAINSNVPRFVEGGNNGDPLTFVDAKPNVAVKAVTSDGSFDLGGNLASLIITDNKAELGGGIGANGGVVIGKEDKCQIPVEKTWDHGSNPESSRPEVITVNLKNGDTVIDSMDLTAQSDWKGTFTDLPVGQNYSVEEVSVPGYSAEITGDAENGFVIKNTFVPSGDGGTNQNPPITPLDPDADVPSNGGDGSGDPGADHSSVDGKGSQGIQTGDSSNVLFWLAVVVIAALVACGAYALSRAQHPRGAHSVKRK